MTSIPAKSSNIKQIALLSVLLLALSGVVVWQYQASKSMHPTPVTRGPSDFIVAWRCTSCRHEYEAPGDSSPRACPKCNKPTCYTLAHMKCPVHGRFDVLLEVNAKGRLGNVKVADQPWIPEISDGQYNVCCPKCRKPLFADDPVKPVVTPDAGPPPG